MDGVLDLTLRVQDDALVDEATSEEVRRNAGALPGTLPKQCGSFLGRGESLLCAPDIFPTAASRMVRLFAAWKRSFRRSLLS